MSSSAIRTDEQRRLAREYVEAWRDRRRHGRLILSIEVGPLQMAGLERLGLLGVGERDKSAVAWAVERFLNAASHLASMGDAIWPSSEEPSDERLAV